MNLKLINFIILVDNCDAATELTIIDLIRYSLEHADKNLPSRRRFMDKVCLSFKNYLQLIAIVLFCGIMFVS